MRCHKGLGLPPYARALAGLGVSLTVTVNAADTVIVIKIYEWLQDGLRVHQCDGH
ncbi:MAG: hypothetical protein LBG24_04190 [Treponema sp.]|nr:hypothetical protein [Treponema sp.]